jgi:tetratricopeptide (TPR) repeat protein
VFQAALTSLGPRRELLNQWVTLEQQSQRITAARAVLGFMDAALQQQQRSVGQAQEQPQQHLQQQQGQAQQVVAAPQASEQQQQEQQEQGSDQQQHQPQQQQQQQQRSRRMRRQPQLPSQAAAAEAVQAGDSTASTLSTPVGQVAPELASYAEPAVRAAAQPELGSSSSSSSSRHLGRPGVNDGRLAPELQQQLEQLVTALNNMGLATRQPQQGPSTSAAAVQTPLNAEAAPQQQQQHDQQQHDLRELQQQQQVRLPTYSLSVQGLQQHVPALASAAAMEHRAGNVARALKLYNAASQQDPANPRLIYSLVQLHMKRGDTAAVEEQLQKLEALQPGNGFLCYSRGSMAQQEGQLALARQWYEKGMRAPGEAAAAAAAAASVLNMKMDKTNSLGGARCLPLLLLACWLACLLACLLVG